MSHPQVELVRHPAWSNHPGRATLTGYSGLFAFDVDASIDVPAFVDCAAAVPPGRELGRPREPGRAGAGGPAAVARRQFVRALRRQPAHGPAACRARQPRKPVGRPDAGAGPRDPADAPRHAWPWERSLPSEPVALPGTPARTIRSSGSGQLYRIYVATPAEAPPPGGFPVLYMLDANASFLTMAQTMAVLSIWRDGTGVQPMVIVGIGYPDRAGLRRQVGAASTTRRQPLPGGPEQHHAHRLPYPMGGAERFLGFIDGDVKPLIERELRSTAAVRLCSATPSAACSPPRAVHPAGELPELRRGQPVDHLGRARDHRRGGPVCGRPRAWPGPPPGDGRRVRAEARPLRAGLAEGSRDRSLLPRVSHDRPGARTGRAPERRWRRPHLSAEFRLFEGEGHMSLVPTSASHSLRFISARAASASTV